MSFTTYTAREIIRALYVPVPPEWRFHRYRKLLAEAVEPRRVAPIDLLVEEQARDRLEAQRAADRKAMTAMTTAKVLGTSRT